jgi:hypothetical protein
MNYQLSQGLADREQAAEWCKNWNESKLHFTTAVLKNKNYYFGSIVCSGVEIHLVDID